MFHDFILHTFYRKRWRGFITLHRLFGENGIIAANQYGVRFRLDPHDYIGNHVLDTGFYEIEVFEACREALLPGSVFWDIGGCFGLHSVTAKKILPGIDVHVFEPSPVNRSSVEKNAALNRIKIAIWSCALGESDGMAPFYPPPRGNAGLGSLCRSSASNCENTLTVEVARADTLIASGRAPAPNVIKLDVEGSELAVLSGLGEYLSSPALTLIVLEAEPAILDPASDNPLRTLIMDAGFYLSPLPRNKSEAHALINVAAKRNR